MYRNIIAAILVLSLVSIIMCGRSFADSKIVKSNIYATSMVIPEFSTTNSSVDDVIQKLWEDGVRVCYERKDNAPKGSITMNLFGTNCKEVLQNMVKQDPEYQYDIDSSTGLPNVYPRTGSVLDYKLAYYIIDDSTLESALSDHDSQLRFREHRVGLFSVGVEPDDLYLHVSISMKSTTARACLNALIAKGNMIKWEIRSYSNGFNALYVNPLPL